jgi:hypothetical protein
LALVQEEKYRREKGCDRRHDDDDDDDKKGRHSTHKSQIRGILKEKNGKAK